MGIPGLWKAIAPSMENKSLTEMIMAEALTKAEMEQGCVNIGIDAMPWLYAVQGSLIAARKKGASWALTGGDAERNLLLKRLAYWNDIPANIGFYFDGPNIPDEKRGRRVRSRPHGLIHVFKELIRGFNFRVVEAPGEAEAELAHLNEADVLHHIVTPDADAFLFGAKSVIRSASKDQDSAEVYTEKRLHGLDPDRLSRAGILFVAVVSGGDYSPGLPNCGFSTAFALAKSRLAIQLWDLAHSNRSDAEVECSRMAWRERLCDELTNNSSRLLSRCQPVVAQKAPADFPRMSIVRQYAKPATTDLLSFVCSREVDFWTRSDLTVPDSSAITGIICDTFPHWSWSEVFGKLERCVLPGHLARQLINVNEARTLLRTQGLGFASVNAVTKVERPSKDRCGAFPYYRVLIWPLYASNKAFDVFLAKRDRSAAPGEVTAAVQAHVPIPGPILDRAIPEKVDDYFREHPHAQPVPRPSYLDTLREKILSKKNNEAEATQAGPSNHPSGYTITVENGREVLEICDD